MSARILITGCNGYLGQSLLKNLSQRYPVVGLDIQPQIANQTDNVHYYCCDIRSEKVSSIIDQHQIRQVVHLASVMRPGADPTRDYDIDINGTQNLLNACIKHQVEHILVTSSGAAYGYYADNPLWLRESDPLRGHPAFTYSQHKMLIEQLLQRARQTHPELKQLILRPGTVLGRHTDNLITRLFHRPRLLKIAGSDSPFVFIWDEDVRNIMLQGIEQQVSGTYNLAGDGALTIGDIANILEKPLLTLPAWLLSALLRGGKALGVSAYGPEQLDFLRYRPVLDNHALKHEFGYRPAKTSLQTFQYFAQQQGLIE